MQTVKVNNPLYLGRIAQRIQEYYRRINPVGITYETLYAYLCNIVQYGQQAMEFYIALDDESQPVGFAVFTIMPLPYVGMVHFDHIYTWGKHSGVTNALVDEAERFADKHNARLMDLTFANPAVTRLFKRLIQKRGNLTVIETERENFIVRK